VDHRIALVTGASRGIGRAIACQLAADGLLVVINYRSRDDAADDALRQISAAGGSAVLKKFDVSIAAQVDAAVKQITSELGTIDALVNNAAVGRDKPLLRVKPDEWERTLATNVTGVHHCTQAVVKTWVGKRCGSRIVNVTSVGAERGYRDSTTYCASKAAVIGYTKSLAHELAPKNVTVNAVSPGFVMTELTAHMPPELYIRQTPLGRAGRPEDVANAVSFLVSERAAFITGEVLRVNGGMYT